MWSFEITAIDALPSATGAGVSFSLDRPAVGTKHGNATIEIAGWALGTERAVDNIVVNVEQMRLATLPVKFPRVDVVEHFKGVGPRWLGRVGFSQAVQLEYRPGTLELEIAVEMGGRSIPMRRISGTFSTAVVPPSTKFAPIMLTSLGRSGTTLLMRSLSLHPEITATRLHPYEIELAQHMVKALQFALGYDRAYLVNPDGGFLTTEFVTNACGFYLDQIDRFYKEISRVNAQPAAHYYIEKFRSTGMQHWFGTLYPGGAKEIFLVRDFRDIFASIIAFEKKSGYFITAFDDDEREAARNWSLPAQLLDQWKERSDRALLVRYEELIHDRPRSLARIFEYLEVEASPEIINTVLEEAARPNIETTIHRTSESPEASIARWRNDLSHEVQCALHASVDRALAEFGYELPRATAPAVTTS